MLAGPELDRVRFNKQAAVLLLAITLLLSLLLLRAEGTSDVGMFLIWGALGHEHGVLDGYRIMVENWPETVLGGNRAAGGGEYPPLGFAWLTMVRSMSDGLGLSPLLGYKINLLACSFVSTGLILLMSRSLVLTAAFHAATILSVSGLGYMDIVAAPAVIGALWAMREDRPVLGFTLLIFGILIKWQFLIIAPVLLVHMLNIRSMRDLLAMLGGKLFWRLVGTSAVIGGGTAAIFGLLPVQALLLALRHPFLSGTTMNVPWIATFLWRVFFDPDFVIAGEVDFLLVPPGALLPFKIMFFALFALIMLRFIRADRNFRTCLYTAILVVLTYAVWNSAVHENHWFVALIPAFFMAAHSPATFDNWVALWAAILLNVNLFVFYGITGIELLPRHVGIDLSVVASVLFLAVWWLLMVPGWRCLVSTKSVPQRAG